MPNWYCYILIALLGKSAEFKCEMFAIAQSFAKKGKRREYFKLRNHDCVSLLFHAVFLVGGEQHLESQPAFRIDL